MTTIRGNRTINIYRNMCIVMIWFITIYSSIIQYVFFQIPYAMLLLGAAILFFYYLDNSQNQFVIRQSITEEDIRMLWFMAYILIIGLVFAPDRNNHISQWITCLEYLFIQIVIASMIKKSGTEAFHSMLMVEAVFLAFVFLRNPVDYQASGRFSISEDVNPNGLGLGLVAGIWAVLYRQYNKDQSIVLTGGLVAVLGYCILLTGSRKSLIGAGLAILLWMVFCFAPGLKEKGSRNGILSFFAMFAIVIILSKAFMSVYANTSIATRMDRLFYEASEGKRSNMYLEGYELFKQNPLFGIGFQGFKYFYKDYSHASLVEIPVSGGVIGTILYFSAYIISIKKLVYIYKRTKDAQEYYLDNKKIKMLIILWVIMAFYTVCIIHPYQFDSGIYFGIIFGESAYIERKIDKNFNALELRKIGSKYIKI